MQFIGLGAAGKGDGSGRNGAGAEISGGGYPRPGVLPAAPA